MATIQDYGWFSVFFLLVSTFCWGGGEYIAQTNCSSYSSSDDSNACKAFIAGHLFVCFAALVTILVFISLRWAKIRPFTHFIAAIVATLVTVALLIFYAISGSTTFHLGLTAGVSGTASMVGQFMLPVAVAIAIPLTHMLATSDSPTDLHLYGWFSVSALFLSAFFLTGGAQMDRIDCSAVGKADACRTYKAAWVIMCVCGFIAFFNFILTVPLKKRFRIVDFIIVAGALMALGLNYFNANDFGLANFAWVVQVFQLFGFLLSCAIIVHHEEPNNPATSNVPDNTTAERVA